MTNYLDSVLLLYCVRGASPVYGRLKLQKTHFLVENALRDAGMVGPHFSFVRHHNGPFSQDLWNCADSLIIKGLLAEDEGYWLTNRGAFILDLVGDPLREANQRLFSVIDEELSHCRRRSGEALMNEVYALEVVPEGAATQTAIRDIPAGQKILAPPAIQGLDVSEDLMRLIVDAMSTTECDLDEARGRIEEIDRDATAMLLAALA